MTLLSGSARRRGSTTSNSRSSSRGSAYENSRSLSATRKFADGNTNMTSGWTNGGTATNRRGGVAMLDAELHDENDDLLREMDAVINNSKKKKR